MEYLDRDVKIEFNSKKHIYKINDEIYPSVTKILNIIDKSAPLMHWAVSVSLEYLSNNIEKIKTGELSLDKNKNIFKEAKIQHRLLKETAADIGTRTHYAIEKFIKGESYKHLIDDDIYLPFEAFTDWYLENDFDLIDSERIVYSQKLKVCGTVDIVCKLNGKNFLVDLKTSKGIYPEMLYQISVYKKFYEQNFGLKIQGLAILHLNKNTGKFKFHEYTNQQYRDAYKSFVYLSKFYHSIHKRKK